MSESYVADSLLVEAQSAPARPSRSKLETHRAAICELRRKRWTFAEIAGWLKERGVSATTSNVHRFFQANKRQPHAVESLPMLPAPPTAPVESKPKRKIRFNLRES